LLERNMGRLALHMVLEDAPRSTHQ
jgi:hypothetical protein